MRGWIWAAGAVLVAMMAAFAALGGGQTAVPPLLPLVMVLIVALPVVSFRAWSDQSRVPR